MELTNEIVGRYVGGQMEILNPREGYMRRGEIAEIGIEGENLKVRFSWLAKGEGYPPLPKKWVNDDTLDFGINLTMCGVSDSFGEARIAINDTITGELSMLFLPGGSKLDPAQVEGLKLAEQPSP